LFAYSSGDLAQISAFPAIDMSGITGVSPILQIKVYRDDNTTAGDVLGQELDFHYQRDSFGSEEEYAKR